MGGDFRRGGETIVDVKGEVNGVVLDHEDNFRKSAVAPSITLF